MRASASSPSTTTVLPAGPGQATDKGLVEAAARAALQPLPRHPWDWGEWVPRKVGPNGYVRIERNHYSVPEGHIGRAVTVRVGERMVEVFLEDGARRIAVHRRKSGRNQYATRPEHMPDRLKAVRDIRKPDYAAIRLARARRVGPSALAWAERCFASRDFPEQAFATVQGMIRLAEDHGEPRLEELCAEALDLDRLAMLIEREAAHREHRSYQPDRRGTDRIGKDLRGLRPGPPGLLPEALRPLAPRA